MADDDDRPKWLREAEYVYISIADDLAARIERRELRGRLPSESELAAEYGVARMTIRRAVQVLRERELVRTLHGRGTYVVPR